MLRQKRIVVAIFDERLQSEIIFILQQKMFLMDDHIFEEGDKEDRFYEQEEEEETKLFQGQPDGSLDNMLS